MEINMDDLRQICDRLIQNVKEKGIDSINLEVDYYWNIPQNQLYNPYQKPVDLDMGQLSDNWTELRKVLQSQKEPLGYHLVWLAAILRALGESITL